MTAHDDHRHAHREEAGDLEGQPHANVRTHPRRLDADRRATHRRRHFLQRQWHILFAVISSLMPPRSIAKQTAALSLDG